MRARRGARGFTLIELMIVIAIISVIAAIAIPSLAQSRLAAAEAQAVGTMKAIYSAQALYKNRSAAGDYASSLSELAPVIDNQLAGSGVRGGYVFAMVGGGIDYKSSWAVSAWPIGGVDKGAGSYNYWIDDSGVIRASKGHVDATSPPLQ